MSNSRQDRPKVDRDIAVFRDRLAAATAEHGPPPQTLDDRRSLAEKVRAPWVEGGPQMARTVDIPRSGARPPCRLYLPTEEEGRPLLIYIHGGGWTLFSIETHDRLMREYAARSGLAVLGPDYSLSPEVRYPVAIEELAATLDWARGEGRKNFGFDGRIVVGGDSAGANLAIGTALRERDAGRDDIAGLLLNYGAFDPKPRASWQVFGGPEYNLTADEMADFWTNYLGDLAPGDATYALPLDASLTALPPVHMCVAGGDILAEENREMASALRAAGVRVDLAEYPTAIHSFLEAVSISDVADRALQTAADWMRRLFD